jgi:hypothetical protein
VGAAIEISDGAVLTFRLRQVLSSDTISAQLETGYERLSTPNESDCPSSATAPAGGGVEGRSELRQQKS